MFLLHIYGFPTEWKKLVWISCMISLGPAGLDSLSLISLARRLSSKVGKAGWGLDWKQVHFIWIYVNEWYTKEVIHQFWDDFLNSENMKHSILTWFLFFADFVVIWKVITVADLTDNPTPRLRLSTETHLYTPLKTNMTMEQQPFEDVSPIKNDDFPLSC